MDEPFREDINKTSQKVFYSKRVKLFSVLNEDKDLEDFDLMPDDISLLDNLPLEILHHIFSQLEWYHLIKMAQTCKLFQNIINSSALWSQLYNLDFSHCSEIPTEKVMFICQQMRHAEILRIDGATDDLLLDIIQICPKLKHFWLSQSSFGNLTVKALLKYLTRVETLSISYNHNVCSDIIQDFLIEQSEIRKLCINRCDSIVYFNIQHKSDVFANLISISLIGLRLLPENIECLAKSCPFLEYLDLTDVKQLTNIGADRVESCFQCLKTLILTNCSSLMELELLGLSKLEVLDVSYCRRLMLLDVQSDSLSKTDFSHCFLLRHVKLDSLNLIDVNLSYLTSLELLTLRSPCLSILNISETKITMEKLLILPNLNKIEQLTINGCQFLGPESINSALLPAMTSLKHLNIGSDNWSTLNLSSGDLLYLSVKDAKNLSSLTLNMIKLEYLELENCQELTEEIIFDGIIFGQQFKKSKEKSSDVFKSTCNQGVPNLKTLKISKMQNIEGRTLSQLGHLLMNLTTLDIRACAYLKRIDLKNWPNLENILIESCNKLSTCIVIQCARVKQLYLKWCCMIHTFQVLCPHLEDFCSTGTNFAHFSLESDTLKNLSLTGISIAPEHTLHINCPGLEEVAFNKCDQLSSEALANVMAPCVQLQKLHLSSCHNISYLNIPEALQVLTLSSLKRLDKIHLSWMSSIKTLHLCALPKIMFSIREQLLLRNQNSLQELHLKVLNQEEHLSICLPNLMNLVLDQGLFLASLDLDVPKLSYLRIQGCPRLSSVGLHVNDLTCLGIDHVTPMTSLTSLILKSNTTTHLGKLLASYVPNVERITLQISDLYVNLAFLSDLAYKLVHLERIIIQGCRLSSWIITQKSRYLELDIGESSIDRNNSIIFVELL